MSDKRAIIIGAGPAGLTAAYELLKKTGIKPIILEMTEDIGGISKTVDYKGNKIDIGGHRFFSKSRRVMEWWREIMPFQEELGAEIERPAELDPEKTDNIMLLRRRISRIFFLRKFFDYPITLSSKTLSGLGIVRTTKIGMSYIRSRLFPIREERSLEDFFINRFGVELYRTFFKDYTEKVWGVKCDKIEAEWGAQRIKGLSVTKTVLHAIKRIYSKDSSIGQKDTETSLIEQFLYPKFGPGQVWEEVARLIKEDGGKIHLGRRVVGIKCKGTKITGIEVNNEKTGKTMVYRGDYFFSSMPVRELISGMDAEVPQAVAKAADGLVYRDFITVGTLLKRLKIKNDTQIKTHNDIVPDNWMYIQERDVQIGRLQIFNNWSPYMVNDSDTVWLGLEYFCNEGDELWSMADEDLKKLAGSELDKIGIIDKRDIIDGTVIRMPKAYPAYFGTYNQFYLIKDFTDKFTNLFLVGRNGMHRYNNQDHSMLSAMTAVENIVNGVTTKDNIWAVNTEKEYAEEKLTSIENLTEGFLKESESKDGFQYDSEVYWDKTELSYPTYPTVRHRKRFIIDALMNHNINKDSFIFDYGCGEGGVLNEVKKRLRVDDNVLGGCEIAKIALDVTKKNIKSPYFYNEVFPKLDRKCDVIICSELIEHTKDYLHTLYWIRNNLKDGGLLILTTQSGKIHPSDRYTGHTQHFDIKALNSILIKFGFVVESSKLWGFPFFTLQKYLTSLNFDSVRENYLEGDLTFKKRLVFMVAYAFFFLHDYIGFGPQIYILATKRGGGGRTDNGKA